MSRSLIALSLKKKSALKIVKCSWFDLIHCCYLKSNILIDVKKFLQKFQKGYFRMK